MFGQSHGSVNQAFEFVHDRGGGVRFGCILHGLGHGSARLGVLEQPCDGDPQCLAHEVIWQQFGSAEFSEAQGVVGLVVFGHIRRGHQQGGFADQRQFRHGHRPSTGRDQASRTVGQVHTVHKSQANDPIAGIRFQPGLGI